MRLLLAFMLAVAIAACVNHATAQGPSAVLSWTAPTTYTNGSLIGSATITYNIYQGLTGQEGTTPVQTNLSATTATITAGLTPGTTQCFEVTALVAGVESAKSNEACKTFAPLVPSAPTSLTVH